MGVYANQSLEYAPDIDGVQLELWRRPIVTDEAILDDNSAADFGIRYISPDGSKEVDVELFMHNGRYSRRTVFEVVPLDGTFREVEVVVEDFDYSDRTLIGVTQLAMQHL